MTEPIPVESMSDDESAEPESEDAEQRPADEYDDEPWTD
jgi:hypothetical protein